MTASDRYTLISAAIDTPDFAMFLAEWSTSIIFIDPESEAEPDWETITDTLTRIHAAVYMSVKELLHAAGLTQTAAAERFCIPLRTVNNWCASGAQHRECPLYTKLMIAELLGLMPSC